MTYFKYLSAFRDVKYLKTTNTSQQMTSASANVITVVNGSEITYTPAQGAEKVIYEIMFYSEIIDDNTYVSAQIQEYDGAAWVKIEDRYTKNWGLSGSAQRMRYCVSFRYILPAWANAKQLRLVIASSADNAQLGLHQLTDWDGSSATDQFCDTTLIVYSV